MGLEYQGSRLLGGPKLALANALEGDFSAAGRALRDPQSLSPSEALTVRERFEFLKRTGMDQGPWGRVVEAVTNPWVLMGLALHLPFGSANPAKIEQALARAAHKAKRPNAFLKWWETPRNLFEGTKRLYGVDIADEMTDTAADIHKFQERLHRHMVKAWGRFKEEAGRDWGHDDDLLLSAALDRQATKGPRIPFSMFERDGTAVTATTTEARKALRGRQATADGEAMQAWLGTLEGSPHRKVIETWKESVFQGAWDMLLGSSEGRRAVAEAMAKGAGKTRKALVKELTETLELKTRQGAVTKEEVLKVVQDFKRKGFDVEAPWLAGYYPHMLPRDIATFDQMMGEMAVAYGGAPEEQAADIIAKQLAELVTGNLKKRKGIMLQDADDLDAFAKAWPQFARPEAIEHTKRYLYGDAAFGKGYQGYKGAELVTRWEGDPGVIPVYSMRAGDVTQRYVQGMARVYSFTAKGHGRKFYETAKAMAKNGDNMRAEYLKGSWLPQLAGRQGYWEGIQAASDAQKALARAKELKEGKGLWKLVPGKWEDPRTPAGWLYKQFTNPKSMGSLRVGQALSELGYAGALAGSPGAVAQNAMQPVQTLLTILGPEAFAKGAEAYAKGLPKYVALRAKGWSQAKATRATWKAYGRSGLSETGFAQEVRSGVSRAGPEGGEGALRRVYRKVIDVGMAPFSEVENMNRIMSFEGGMWAAAKRGGFGSVKSALRAGDETADEVTRYGTRMVNELNWPSGAHNRPLALLKGPLSGKLMSMFATFPISFANLLTMTARRMGREQGNYRKILGRMMLTGGLTYEAAIAAGEDPSKWMTQGAVPMPRMEGSAFYPFPLVPPVLGAAGNVAMDLMAGKLDKTRYSLPMMVPGGVAAAKASMLFGSDRMARLLGRQYVDYEAPAPDGRYAVMTEDGKLVGYETMWGLLQKASGVPFPGGGLQDESEFVAMLVKNRDRIREARREYTDAIMGNRMDDARKVGDQYKRAFGMELTLKKSDLDAIEKRRMLSRLESVMQTMPKELRAEYAGAVQSAVGMLGGDEFLGVSPEQMGAKTPGELWSQRPGGQRMKRPEGFQRQGSYKPGFQGAGTDPMQIQRRELPQVAGGFGGF